MIFIDSGSKKWTDEKEYLRGVLLPFGNSIDSGLQVQETIIKANCHVPDHFHKEQTEFIYVVKGSLEMNIDGRAFSLNKGDLIIIQPGEVHSAANSNPTDTVLLAFKINGSPDDSEWLK
jgi:quercetin dioxygenase-like cupin family protein